LPHARTTAGACSDAVCFGYATPVQSPETRFKDIFLERALRYIREEQLNFLTWLSSI